MMTGRYTVTCVGVDGQAKWRDDIQNVIMTVGKNAFLDAALAGTSYTVTGPFIGLIAASGYVSGPIAADTMASHPGWFEAGPSRVPQYTGSRPVASWGVASNGAKSLSTPAQFPITSTGAVKGCFIVFSTGASAVKDSTGGVLFSAGLFSSGDKNVSNGDTLSITYTVQTMVSTGSTTPVYIPPDASFTNRHGTWTVVSNVAMLNGVATNGTSVVKLELVNDDVFLFNGGFWQQYFQNDAQGTGFAPLTSFTAAQDPSTFILAPLAPYVGPSNAISADGWTLELTGWPAIRARLGYSVDEPHNPNNAEFLTDPVIGPYMRFTNDPRYFNTSYDGTTVIAWFASLDAAAPGVFTTPYTTRYLQWTMMLEQDVFLAMDEAAFKLPGLTNDRPGGAIWPPLGQESVKTREIHRFPMGGTYIYGVLPECKENYLYPEGTKWGGGGGGAPIINVADGSGNVILLKSMHWYVMEQRITLNTPSLSDGSFQMWLDGNKVYERTDVRWRDTTTPAGLFSAHIDFYHGGLLSPSSLMHYRLAKIRTSATYIGVPSELAPIVAGATYYVAASGSSDSNAGTIAAPFATLQKAHSLANPGDTIYMRGGTYPMPAQTSITRSGASGSPIKVFAYPGEVPILDGSSNPNAGGKAIIRVDSGVQYWHFKGLETKSSPGYGFYVVGTASNITIEQCNVHHNLRLDNSGGGIQVEFGSNNLILNNDLHHNGHAGSEGGSGSDISSQLTGNVFRGNRAWRNNDNGMAFFSAANVLIENNWIWENGYNDSLVHVDPGDGVGLKLAGGGAGGNHIVRNNVVWKNYGNGIDDNSAVLPMNVYNNTAWSNANTAGTSNYAFYTAIANVLKNNIAFAPNTVSFNAAVQHSFNSWNLAVTVNSADFLSLDYTGASGPRQADGSLPVLSFLKLVASSDLVDKGTNVGIPYTGSTPDLGAYESGYPTWRSSVWVKDTVYTISDTAQMKGDMPVSSPVQYPTTVGMNAADTNTWSGFAADANGLWGVAMGGHSSQWSNKAFYCDLRQTPPRFNMHFRGSDPAPNPYNFTTGTPPIPSANAAYGPPPVWHYADGRPCARHTYYGNIHIAARNRVFMFYDAAHFAQIINGAYDGVDAYNIAAHDYDPANTWSPHNMGDASGLHPRISAAKHPVTEDVYMTASGTFKKWTQATAAWSLMSIAGPLVGHSWQTRSSLVDGSRNRWLTVQNENYLDYIDLTISGGLYNSVRTPLNLASAPNWLSDCSQEKTGGCILVHDLDNDRYLYFIGQSQDDIVNIYPAKIYAITPAGVVTLVTTLPTAIVSQAWWTRVHYMQAYGGVVFLPSYYSDLLFLPTR
jgi:hypothetical protein